VENEGLQIEPGKTYRLHLVNVGALSLFHFWIENHNLTIIEVDGVYVAPYSTAGLDIHVGQRYSVLVTMNANPQFNYPIIAAIDDSEGVLKPNATAWLVYNPNGVNPAPQILADWYPFDDFLLTPWEFKGVQPPDCNVTFVVQFVTAPADSPLKTVAPINGISYLPPVTPTMLTAMDAINPWDHYIYGPTTNTYLLRYGDMVYLIIDNETGGAHPCTFSFYLYSIPSHYIVHLHGHTFQVLYRSPPNTNYSQDEPYDVPANPVQRDVLTVYEYGFAIVAFKADNPGVWFFVLPPPLKYLTLQHCHIDWHVLMGMIAQFVEAPDMMQRTLQVPEEIRQQCASRQCQSLHWETKSNGSSTSQEISKENGKANGKELDVEDEMAFMFQAYEIESWWNKAVSFLTRLFLF